MKDSDYKNLFITTGKVLNDPFKIANKRVLEFDILYKDKIKYRINVSMDKFELASFVHTDVKKDMFVDVAGKLRFISATVDYPAHIIIHIDKLKIIFE